MFDVFSGQKLILYFLEIRSVINNSFEELGDLFSLSHEGLLLLCYVVFQCATSLLQKEREFHLAHGLPSAAIEYLTLPFHIASLLMDA